MPQHYKLKARTGTHTVIPSGTDVFVTTAGSNTITASTVTTTTITPTGGVVRSSVSPKNLEDAVYAHLQALHALGKTQVNSIDIAQALNINPGRVSEIIGNLESKGVKIAR